MELVPYGDLQYFLSGGQPRFQEHVCQAVASQMCKALKYLHDSNITHRDIKPDNILIYDQDPYIFKLSDFGLSKVVNNDETFLKSFCGTLLYCAPEVYPGYDGLKRQTRKRLRAPDGRYVKFQVKEIVKSSLTLASFIKNEAKQPYTSAVDTWGLAAVLYHLLCGSPPFPGDGANQGARMLDIVMNTAVDYDKLRLGGVSRYAIDFLKRMLVTDPASRLSDEDCLRHPWITEKIHHDGVERDLEAWTQARPEDYTTRDTECAEEVDLNAFTSQLSIVERPTNGPDENDTTLRSDDVEDIPGKGQSKRKRHGEDELEEEPSLTDYHDDLAASDAPLQAVQRQPRRLFGEVTHSALRSSGALGWHANAALEVDAHANPTPNHLAARSESYYAGESQLSGADYPQAEAGTAITYPRLAVEPVGAAPSLYGAEAMVGQMNMDSIMADDPAPNPGGQPQLPNTERAPEQTVQGDDGAHQSTPSSQGLYSATPPRSVHEPQQPKVPDRESEIQQEVHDTNKTSSQTALKGSHSSGPLEPHSAVPGASASNRATAAETNENGQRAITSANRSQPANVEPSSTNKLQEPAATAVNNSPLTQFPSNTLLGILTTVPGSLLYPKIYLTRRHTGFGRRAREYPWPDALDVRVAKIAFDIFFWRPGLDEELDANPKVNWRAYKDLQAGIHTRSSVGIWINGVKLKQGNGCWLYGIIRTGDVITVFEPKPGVDPSKAHVRDTENLKFKVEILVGRSRRPRREGEVFQVLEEKKMWESVVGRKEGESMLAGSVASESQGSIDDGAKAGGATTADATAPADDPPAAAGARARVGEREQAKADKKKTNPSTSGQKAEQKPSNSSKASHSKSTHLAPPKTKP
ncbi:MAG: hypothetical protein Q9219_004864 [cf. Caloplaca sp. 3 TL-2023]